MHIDPSARVSGRTLPISRPQIEGGYCVLRGAWL
jgi:hypothetical protein